MAALDRDTLAIGLVRIDEEAVAKSNDPVLDDYFTEDYRLAQPCRRLQPRRDQGVLV